MKRNWNISSTSFGLCLCLLLAGCGQSPLQKCIDDQLAAWSVENVRHQEWNDRDQRYRDKNPESQLGSVNIGGVDVPRELLGGDPFGTPPTEESARASANMKCGRAYGRE